MLSAAKFSSLFVSLYLGFLRIFGALCLYPRELYDASDFIVGISMLFRMYATLQTFQLHDKERKEVGVHYNIPVLHSLTSNGRSTVCACV